MWTFSFFVNGAMRMSMPSLSIVIVGEQPDVARRAIEQNVNCLIVCQAGLPEELRELPTKTCIIVTPFDAFRAARMVYHAIEISRICRTDDLEAFHLSDFVDDVKEVVLKSRHRSYPILDENDKVVGTLSRFHLIKPRRKRVVLVDHNEAAQSVPGLEQADILAIIDHHRLADIQTGGPIYFRNEPVGSTATIIAEMYQERGLMPSQNLAGLMAAAIVGHVSTALSTPDTGEITALALEPAYRGRRLGEQLIGCAVRQLRAEGAKRLVVQLPPEHPARGFFRHFGFAEQGSDRLERSIEVPELK